MSANRDFGYTYNDTQITYGNHSQRVFLNLLTKIKHPLVVNEQNLRPDFKKLKAVLEGSAPLSTLSKDCL